MRHQLSQCLLESKTRKLRHLSMQLSRGIFGRSRPDEVVTAGLSGLSERKRCQTLRRSRWTWKLQKGGMQSRPMLLWLQPLEQALRPLPWRMSKKVPQEGRADDGSAPPFIRARAPLGVQASTNVQGRDRTNRDQSDIPSLSHFDKRISCPKVDSVRVQVSVVPVMLRCLCMYHSSKRVMYVQSHFNFAHLSRPPAWPTCEPHFEPKCVASSVPAGLNSKAKSAIDPESRTAPQLGVDNECTCLLV